MLRSLDKVLPQGVLEILTPVSRSIKESVLSTAAYISAVPCHRFRGVSPVMANQSS